MVLGSQEGLADIEMWGLNYGESESEEIDQDVLDATQITVPEQTWITAVEGSCSRENCGMRVGMLDWDHPEIKDLEVSGAETRCDQRAEIP